MEEFQGGRIFTSARRNLALEDEISLTSVGIDIGSSTSHLVFSKITLERVETRYVVSRRQVIRASEIIFTPYSLDGTIDAAGLGAFVARQYSLAGLTPAAINTGALILTGVAVRRANARAIADLFAAEAGKFVSVTAGDALEATLAAHGSGAVARSALGDATVMNVDVGGGTSKIAVCQRGEIVDLAAVDIGARLIALDGLGNVLRIEEAGRHFAGELGVELRHGCPPPQGAVEALAARLAERLFETIDGPPLSPAAAALQRLDPLSRRWQPDFLMLSGGVSEFVHARETRDFGDLGPALARAIVAQAERRGLPIATPVEGIRATVIGASQYTVQVSGSTIYVQPAGTLPLRNLPVVVPALSIDADVIDASAVAAAIRVALRSAELADADRPPALSFRWRGIASFRRLDDFCAGLIAGLQPVLLRGLPLVVVCDGDVGGLIGHHCREERRITNPIVSIDGVDLEQFDFVDIGALIEELGAVPVVIKSLVFPATAALGRDRR